MVVSIAMGWRHLLFANWPFDPHVVEAHLPNHLTLDTYDGDAWMSAVPFTNVDVRPRVFPAGAGVALPELNLRTYVTHEGTPGVYFFSLDADGILAVIGARLFHHLPYYYARITLTEHHGRIRFTGRRRHPGARPVSFNATYHPTGPRYSPRDGTLAHFLTARYRYYTEAPDGSLRYADIHHAPWSVYDAIVTIDAHPLFSANGFSLPDAEPVHLYSPGVDTIASKSKPILASHPGSTRRNE